MSTPVFLVPDGDAVYAVPVEEAKKYALDGESLASAVTFLSEESDVTGQEYRPPAGSACHKRSDGRWYSCGSPR